MSKIIARQIQERDIKILQYLEEHKDTHIEEISENFWPNKHLSSAKTRVEALRRAGHILAHDHENEEDRRRVTTLYNISRTGKELLAKPSAAKKPTLTLSATGLPVIALAPNLAETIARLNDQPEPGKYELLSLRLGGRDALSDIPLATLLQHVPETTVSEVQTAFPDLPNRQAAALRWILRGLSSQIAIRREMLNLIFGNGHGRKSAVSS